MRSPLTSIDRLRALPFVLLLCIAGCASDRTPPAAAVASIDPGDVIVPNEHLRAEGIPPVPKALADRVGKYTEFRAVTPIEWQPGHDRLLVAYRRGATTQLHVIEQPMGPLQPLTDFPDPVSRATFEPKRGDYLVYARDSGGDEAAQLYRLDFATRATTLLTTPDEKHAFGRWNHAGTQLLVTSTQLDRTAGEGGRESVTTELYAMDPKKPATKRRIASLPGGGWEDFCWGAGDRVLYGVEYRAATDAVVWRIDVATGRRTQLLPKPGTARRIAYGNLDVTRDGRTLVYTSDEDGEFSELSALDLATGRRRVLSHDLPWDVDAVVLPVDRVAGSVASTASEHVAALVDVAGRRELHLYDLRSGREIALPTLPPAARAGSVSRVRLRRSPDHETIALTVNSAQSPGDLYTIDVGMGTSSAAEQWTRATVDGVDTSGFREAEVVRWKSFDGLEITGLVNRPPARFTGRRPVLVSIHGGPEGQATIGFLGRNDYFVDELGIALIQPNVRGSSGYGKTFLSLDDGMKREDSVKDIGALLDWIAAQPDLDAKRVMVAGGSYGGYMSLAVATRDADRIAGSIDVVGISNFTSFLQRTESYRRDLRRVEYGDERDPAMRAFFDRISPLANAANITKPLFVVQGRNDPRVPYQEAEQIVARVRASGVPVWFLTADNEGHGFARKPNADFQFYAQVLFVERYLLGGPPGR